MIINYALTCKNSTKKNRELLFQVRGSGLPKL